MRPYHYYHSEKLKIAESLGYDTIDNAYKSLYLTHSMSEIAEIFGVTRMAVSYRLKQYGVKIRKRGKP